MKLIILDRDGVINQDSNDFIKSPDEWIPIAGSLEAIAKLNHCGYRVYVASNQSGVGRGLFDIETLNAIHEKMLNELQKQGGRIEAILFCPHTPEQHCNCRKPRPSLYQEISKRSNQSLHDVPVIGDSIRDLEAAVTVGARPILVRTGKGEQTLLQYADFLSGIACFDDLAQAVDYLLEDTTLVDLA
jgi:D-glycero-D-manno-heptose 1,7-bisphosphate phosphatase